MANSQCLCYQAWAKCKSLLIWKSKLGPIGELRNPKGETGMSDYSNNLWNIGRNETALDRVFNGYIDDVIIFKNALTEQQIIDLMVHNF